MKCALSIMVACLCACTGASETSRGLALRRVVLYQNGIGYFERTGELSGDRFRLPLRAHEVGDVLKTLMVIDRAAGRQRAVSVVLPQKGKGAEESETSAIDILLSDTGSHELTVAYAVPTPIWKAAYRVVLPDDEKGGGDEAKKGLLQAWALVDNASGDAWSRVSLTLATGAPLTFALDLRTPQFVSRPDLTGQLVRPSATGAVVPERALRTDSDGDRIDDADDKCPSEPETYNGLEDEDGCPDRGRVMIQESRIQILDKIYFPKNSDQIRPPSIPIIDAIAAALKGNPQITRLEVQGHASTDEAGAWPLAERRAGAVRRMLLDRGVDPGVPFTRAYGDTRPIAAGRNEEERERNRRVEFLIARRADDDGKRDEKSDKRETQKGSITLEAAAAASPQRGATPQDVAGTVHYALEDPVTIPQGSSAMVSIVNQLGTSEDVYLFRPDSSVPGSDLHPLRAARLRTELALEPGPVAVFARGSFVGEGLLSRLHPGETAFIPYALDSSSSVKGEAEDREQPVKLVALRRGVATVEDVTVHTTRYDVQVGDKPPARLFIRHRRAAGFTTKELLPQTESTIDSHLLPVPLAAGNPSVVTVEERRSHQREIRLADRAEEIAPYLAGGGIAPDVEKRLRELLALRAEQQKIDGEMTELRQRLSDASDRSGELRDNLQTIEKMASAQALRQQLLARLSEASKQVEQLSAQLVGKSEAQAAARARIHQALIELSVDEAGAK